jgi:hypothetical protein
MQHVHLAKITEEIPLASNNPNHTFSVHSVYLAAAALYCKCTACYQCMLLLLLPTALSAAQAAAINHHPEPRPPTTNAATKAATH